MKCLSYRSAKKILDAFHDQESTPRERRSAWRCLKDHARAEISFRQRTGMSYTAASNAVWQAILHSEISAPVLYEATRAFMIAAATGCAEPFDQVWAAARDAASMPPPTALDISDIDDDEID